MAVEILVIGRGGIRRGERREKLRNEIDEHVAGCAPIWERSQRISISSATDSDLTFLVLSVTASVTR